MERKGKMLLNGGERGGEEKIIMRRKGAEGYEKERTEEE